MNILFTPTIKIDINRILATVNILYTEPEKTVWFINLNVKFCWKLNRILNVGEVNCLYINLFNGSLPIKWRNDWIILIILRWIINK